MTKTIYFDLDGTLADLYNYPDWLPHLRSESVKPFSKAKPLLDMEKFERTLKVLQMKDWKIGIISWLPMGATKKYEDRVRYAKIKWIRKYLPNLKLDEIHLTKYGKDKSFYAQNKHGILFDDNKEIRSSWTGKAYNEKNIENILDMIGWQ